MADNKFPFVALVGCGQWGKNIARNLAQLGALRVICDADAVRGGAMAKDLGAEFSTDIGSVLLRGDITAVAVATPAVTHAQIVGKALDAGKHVFVEKPIALSVFDANAVATKARAKKLTLMTGHLLQYHPVFMHLLALVREGKLGKVQYVYSNRLNQGRVRTEENALWSLAPHDISMILALAGGKPKRVTAMGQASVQPGIPDIATANFEFVSGIKAHLFCSWLNPYKEHRLAVVGDKAMAVFEDSAAKWEDELVLYPHRVEWNGTIPEFVKAAGEVVTVAKGEPLRDEMEHFLSCVDGKAVCRTGPEEAVPVLEVLAAAQRAMDTSTPIEL
ncbi:MAG: Gfo/Idh/MocA family oxidoreductase [Alphaproteobacteria bacterium]|nr:Gfo/Idh/MocA family oxidoreductase [Alphaproteobacteria bacterium]